MGFIKFQPIKTGRFIEINSDEPIGWKNAHPVYSKDGIFEYYIQPSDQESYLPTLQKDVYEHEDKNKTIQFRKVFNLNDEDIKIIEPWDPNDGKTDKYYHENHCISCKAIEEKSIYINPEGYITPCCWTGYPFYDERNETHTNQFRGILHDFGLDNLSAKKHSIESIVNGPWFQKVFPKGWSEKDPAKGKILLCAKYCGEKFSPVKNEYEIESDNFTE